MVKAKTVKLSEDTHQRLANMCSKNVSFSEIITFILEVYEGSMYYALEDEGHWYELGYCDDCFDALETAKKHNEYNPEAPVQLFKGTVMLVKSGETVTPIPEGKP